LENDSHVVISFLDLGTKKPLNERVIVRWLIPMPLVAVRHMVVATPRLSTIQPASIRLNPRAIAARADP
jgi:hypothetical protein